MTASLSFSGTGLTPYTVPGTHTLYGGGAIQYAADGASIFLPNTDSFIQLVDNAICVGLCSVESTVNWNNTFVGNEFGLCFIDAAQTGFSLIVTPTLVRLRNEVAGSPGSTISQSSTATTGTADVVFKVDLDLSTGAITVLKNGVSVLTGTYSGTTTGLRAGLQVYHASDNPIHAYRTLNTVTSTTAKTIVTINSGSVRVGSTGNTIDTLNMTTLTGLTIGGKAMTSLSATDGDGTFSAPSFVDGQTYALMGSRSAVATDATGSASKNVTLQPPTGWTVTTLEAPLNTTTGVITGLSPAAQAGEQIVYQALYGDILPSGVYQGDFDGTFQIVRIRLDSTVDIYNVHTVAPSGGSTASPSGTSLVLQVGTPVARGAGSVTPTGRSLSLVVGTATASGGVGSPGNATPSGVSVSLQVGTSVGRGSARASPTGVSLSLTNGTPVSRGAAIVQAVGVAISLVSGLISFPRTDESPNLPTFLAESVSKLRKTFRKSFRKK